MAWQGMAWHDGAAGLMRRWSVSESRLSDEIARFRVGLMMNDQTGVWPGVFAWAGGVWFNVVCVYGVRGVALRGVGLVPGA